MTASASLPSTGRRSQHRRRSVRLSEAVFGLSWSELVPCPLGSHGAVLRSADYSEVQGFLARHRRTLVAPEVEGGSFTQLEDGPAKVRFCQQAMDSFVIEEEGEAVGVFMGQAWDWSTYYLRYLAVLPNHRGQGAVAEIIDRFGIFLGRYGFERLEADVSLSHLSQLRRVIGCGFYPMGTLHSDRWGALVHLVRFLSEDHENVFLRQFSAGLRSPTRRPARSDSETRTTDGRD